MGDKLLFLADLHLCPEAPERLRFVCDFLRTQRHAAAGIFILGDLFDYWVGAKQLRLRPWAEILEALAESLSGGPPAGVIGGNRDYLLDPASLAPYGLLSLGMEHWFTRDGLRFCLVHGHMQFPDPPLSRLFLRFIQSGFMRRVAGAAPLAVSDFVATSLRRWRRFINWNKDPAKARRYDPARFASFFERGADVVICGHNHWARDYSPELSLPGKRLLAVGTWTSGPSYLEYSQGTFRLVDPIMLSHD